MRQKLTLVTLGVDDIRKSVDFYEKGLGWKRSAASMDDMILFPLGGIVLGLYPRVLLAQDAGVNIGENDFSGITLSYNAKDEKEVDLIFKQLEQLRATILKSPQKAFWGGYHGYFKDPDGHLFEVAYNPFWKLDENDNLNFP